MSRRLRLPSSSDEEDEDHQTLRTLISRNSQNPNPSSNPSANPSSPLEISDDDFLDAAEVISPPPSSPPPAGRSSDPARPVDDFLRNLGLQLRREWLDSCISALSASRPGFATSDVAEKAKLCFSQFLLSDMNFCGSGVLPAGVHAMHGVELSGPFVLQVRWSSRFLEIVGFIVQCVGFDSSRVLEMWCCSVDPDRPSGRKYRYRYYTYQFHSN